jgi:hypothetical protein
MRVSQMLNKHYGKATTNDAVQSFRAPGFKNMKPEVDGSCPTVALIHAKRGDCTKLAHMLQRVTMALSIAKKTVPVVDVPNGRSGASLGEVTEADIAHVKSIRGDAFADKLQVRSPNRVGT